MLANSPVSPAIPAKDINRARAFYRDVLGLQITDDTGTHVTFGSAPGTVVIVFETEYAGTNQATAAGWGVDDIVDVMAQLRAKGVVFEDYDTPSIKTVDGLADFDGNKVAYFKDSEGNMLSLAQVAPSR